MTHSPEPWKADIWMDGPVQVVDAKGNPVTGIIYDFTGFEEAIPPKPADLQRIAACVNAMKGIKDPGQFVKDVESLAKAASGSRLLLPTYQGELKTVIEHLDIELPT